MRFTSSTISIVAPLLSLTSSVTSVVIPFGNSSQSYARTESLPMATPFPPKVGAPKGAVPDAKQQWQVKRILDGTSNETIIGLEPWYWPKAGCCRLHHDEVVDCYQGHKLFHFPADVKECERKRRIWESCRMNLGYSTPDHQKWQVCYYTASGTPPPIYQKHPPPGVGNGSRLIGPEDTGAMHCLTDLHYRHKYACIALAGSACPISPRGEETWIKTGHLEVHTRLSAECSRTMQGAEDSLVGLNVSNVKVVVYATHANWKVSAQIVFWGPGNWDSSCDKHLQGRVWGNVEGKDPLPGGEGAQTERGRGWG